MFGYVLVNQPELKVREYDTYKGYYCGLCRKLKEAYGLRGRMVLSYDLTFLTLVLTGMYEPKDTGVMRACIAHPGKKHLEIYNSCTEYAADMNVLLTYYKLLDDWKDDRKLLKMGLAGVLLTQAEKVKKKYPKKAKIMIKELRKLGELESRNEKSLDAVAGCFGRITEELFAYREDEWEAALRRFGFFLGKYIYLADALEDVEKDAQNKEYNPFLESWVEKTEHGDRVRLAKELATNGSQGRTQAIEILKLMMTECAKEFERMPILKNAEIIRNIIYAGVWVRLFGKDKKGGSKTK